MGAVLAVHLKLRHPRRPGDLRIHRSRALGDKQRRFAVKARAARRGEQPHRVGVVALDSVKQLAGALTLLGGDLTGIVRARKLAVATMRNIRQNLFFAFIYNAAGIPVAAGLLYPIFGLLLSPMIAAAAMSLSSVSVIANALRLKRVDL